MPGVASVNSVAYHQWQAGAMTLDGHRYRYATKPGAFSHGMIDPAIMLAAQHVRIGDGEAVALLNGGNGLYAAVAAMRGASHVYLSDRNIVSYQASLRTLEANAVGNATAWLGHGRHGFGRQCVVDLVVVRIPHEKAALVQLLLDAWTLLPVGGRCVITGATNEGAKSAAKLLESLFGPTNTLASESGHRLVVASKRSDTQAVPDELASAHMPYDAFHAFDATVRDIPMAIYTRPGVFSWEHVDEATAILANVFEVRTGESVLDLGCGAGVLGTVAGLLSGGGAVTMLDADVEAVRSARRTAEAAGVRSVRTDASDIGAAVRGEQFDVVLSNPPFHVGKATALNVPTQFLREAHELLVSGGRAYVVANRTLPYEPVMQELFGEMHTVHDGPRFKVLMATKQR